MDPIIIGIIAYVVGVGSGVIIGRMFVSTPENIIKGISGAFGRLVPGWR